MSTRCFNPCVHRLYLLPDACRVTCKLCRLVWGPTLNQTRREVECGGPTGDVVRDLVGCVMVAVLVRGCQGEFS